MSLSRNPARWISVGAAVLGVLVVEGVLTPVEMESYLRLVVAVVMIAFGGGAGLLVEGKVMPVDEKESTYVPRRGGG
ncbi:MAG: hypothetical protein M3R38_26555 [Actinomycetota bacterium]|nr:hypothetical protein [Actinomycetota bacterium]